MAGYELQVRRIAPGRYVVCMAPSEGGAKKTQAFGYWAEDQVENDYRKTINPIPTKFFVDRIPSGAADNANLRQAQFLNFLLQQDAAPYRQKYNQITRTSIPDIFHVLVSSHSLVSSANNEFYEIKPGSKKGEEEGQDKLKDLDNVFRTEKIKHNHRGTKYSPQGRSVSLTHYLAPLFNFLSARLNVRDIKAEFTFTRTEPGLILYWVCIGVQFDGDQEEDVVKHVCRWAIQHVTKLSSQGWLGSTAPEVVEVDQALWHLLPPVDEFLSAILRSKPANEYALVGDQIILNTVIEANRSRVEHLKSLFVAGPRSMTKSPVIQEYTVCLAVIGAAVATQALAAAYLSAGVLLSASTATAAAGSIGAGPGAGAIAPELMPYLPLLRAAANDNAVRAAARAAGVLLVVGAARTSAAQAGQVQSLARLSLVPMTDVRAVREGTELSTGTTVTTGEGYERYFFGRVRVKGFEVDGAWLAG